MQKQATRVVFLIVASPELRPPPLFFTTTSNFPFWRPTHSNTTNVCMYASPLFSPSHGLHQATPTSLPSMTMRTRPKPWWCCLRCLHPLQVGWSHCIPPRSFVHPKFQNRPVIRHTCSYTDQGINLLQRSLPEYSISKLSQYCRHRTSQCLKSCNTRIYKLQMTNSWKCLGQSS